MSRIQKGTAIYLAFLLVSTLFLTELALRVYFSQQVGPRVMLYGTPWHRNRLGLDGQDAEELLTLRSLGEQRTVRQHSSAGRGYTKYFPNEHKVDVDPETGEQFSVTINERGFRGEDFSNEKPVGTLRVLTMGASSTFGYYNRDQTTYPVFLEELLNQSCAGATRFEVINLGIPHLTGAEIAALFFAEGATLDPDIVTFYEGNNDAATSLEEGWLHMASSYLLLAAILDENENFGGSGPLGDLGQQASTRSATFLNAVSKLHEASRKAGFVFIVGNQQTRSMLIERSEMAGVTYDDEVALVRERLQATGSLTDKERKFLIHSVLMHDLEEWLLQVGIPFVDVIDATDSRRDHLVSPVHLSPDGNRVVAAALANQIREIIPCPPTSNLAEKAH